MNEQEFDIKIHNKFPNENFTIVRYGKNSHEDSEFICNNCKRHIIVNTEEIFRNRRIHLCSKCHYMRIDTAKNRKIIIERLQKENINDYEFYMKRNKSRINYDNIRLTCPICNRVSNHSIANLLKNNTHLCQYCQGAKKAKDALFYSQELGNILDNFEILVDYTNAKTDIRIKCKKCGFIRNVKPNNFLHHPNCPKCGKIKSKGEIFISNFLEEHNIIFERQKYFREWNWKLHYYDFYIPQYNLIIEYNGIQHYKNIGFFDSLEHQKQNDLLKKEQALKHNINYLTIGYLNYNNLYNILSKVFDSTTISKESRSKWAEIETILKQDEDIVWYSLETERNESNELI